MSRTRPIFAACAQGLEEVLAAELAQLGATDCRTERAGVEAQADRDTLWRITLGSRIASRVLLPIAEFAAFDRESLYEGAARIPWTRLFEVDQTFAIRATGRTRGLRHTGFIGQVVKDAICDRFREKIGERPSVNRDRPKILIDVHVDDRGARISLDAGGEPLHRRGYRHGTGLAPLKETLAAGCLALSGWTPDQPLFDPMCGSGTFVIEAALIAARVAPGLLRRGGFAFENWLDHDRSAFLRITQELRDLQRLHPVPIHGFDTSNQVLEAAHENARRAGVLHAIQFRKARFERVDPPSDPGVLITNPPYGHRLDADPGMYRDLGDALKQRFGGWTAWILAATQPLKALGLKPKRRIPLRNGALDCRLVCIPLFARRPRTEPEPVEKAAPVETAVVDAPVEPAVVDAPVEPVVEAPIETSADAPIESAPIAQQAEPIVEPAPPAVEKAAEPDTPKTPNPAVTED